MDTNYPSNSYNQRNKEEPKEERHLEPVVAHDVQVRKKSVFQKFTNAFIAEDLNSVKSYVVKELLIPGIKRMFLSTLEMLLNGKGYSGSKKEKQVTTVSYRDYYDKQPQKTESIRNDYLDFDDILFSERGDAEYVLDQMRDVLHEFKVVRVSDMYELSRQSSTYTGNRYGWTDLNSAHVVPVRGGYVIKMPNPMPIDRV